MTTLLDNYRLIRQIGSGGFSTIYLAENQLGEQVAIKSIRKRASANREYYFREARIHHMLSQTDDHVVQLYEMYEDDDYVHYVMEYLAGGDLFDALLKQMKSGKKYFSEKTIKNIIKSLLQTVAMMHEKDIVHRDLKLENLLLVDNDNDNENEPLVKVADFGLALEEVTSNNITVFAGTPLYMAPENHRREAYGKPVDIWAVGLITYLLTCGNLPFGNDEIYAKTRVLRGEFSFREKEWKDTSFTMQSFIRTMLNVDPRLRPTAQQALNHPWFGMEEDDLTESDAVISRKRLLAQDVMDAKRRKMNNNSESRCCSEDESCFDCLRSCYKNEETRFLIPPMEAIFPLSVAH